MKKNFIRLKEILLGTTKAKIVSSAVAIAVVGGTTGGVIYYNNYVNKANENPKTITDTTNKGIGEKDDSNNLTADSQQITTPEEKKDDPINKDKETIKETTDESSESKSNNISNSTPSNTSNKENNNTKGGQSNNPSTPPSPEPPKEVTPPAPEQPKPSKPSGIDYDLTNQVNQQKTDAGMERAFRGSDQNYMRQQVYNLHLGNSIDIQPVTTSNLLTMKYSGQYKVIKRNSFSGAFDSFGDDKTGREFPYYRIVVYYNSDTGCNEYYYYTLLYKDVNL